MLCDVVPFLWLLIFSDFWKYMNFFLSVMFPLCYHNMKDNGAASTPFMLHPITGEMLNMQNNLFIYLVIYCLEQ